MKGLLIAIAILSCVGIINRQQPKSVDLTSLPEQPNGVYQVNGTINGFSDDFSYLENGKVSISAKNPHSIHMPHGASITVVKNGSNIEIEDAIENYIGLERITVSGSTAVGHFADGSTQIITK